MQILHLLEQRSVEEKEVLLQMMKLLNKLRDALPWRDPPEILRRQRKNNRRPEEASAYPPHPTCHPDIPCEGA